MLLVVFGFVDKATKMRDNQRKGMCGWVRWSQRERTPSSATEDKPLEGLFLVSCHIVRKVSIILF